ncbi:PREDICTED: polymerase delta-interacting protein 3-like [Amphimedon queenslandica]|uniref:RRM domain-containing protein n=1 Tax=Amphimedon queenslandica TaxID=400682 RepID=A0A1X7V7S0_AMPQE|nr:PREDICTED: polymerase delta-interacting protein 3-like [Amphimedon queenslandica]|eukprot:XP_003385470.2 PREDICTED: polymerase delta-interacting protein 3-like [Amphimedon queenslandica]
MASNFDKPLDELVNNRGRAGFRGRGRGFRGTGRGASGGFNSKRGGANFHDRNFGAKVGKTEQNGFSRSDGGGKGGVNDLRDVIISKTKPSVTDLRLKLPPKQLSKAKGGGGGGSRLSIGSSTNSKLGSGGRTSKQQIKSSKTYPSMSDHQLLFQKQRPTRSTRSLKEQSPPSGRRLPTSSEAKKITVTVQGLSKTTSEMYRKEERLATAITRQKEIRQHSFMKSREEFLASAITSALGGGGGGAGVAPQVHSVIRSQPSQQQYSRHRSTSPNDYHQFDSRGYEPRPHSFVPPPPPPRQQQQQRGLTTVTTLVISNLNDTVSRNDVSELCSAVGPVETVNMIAPGVAEVTYRYKDDALEAFKKYNQRNLDGMPMVCRLQSGAGSGRPRSSINMSIGGYASRMMDSYQSEAHPSMFNSGGAGMDGFY